jgi:hypothetical protein
MRSVELYGRKLVPLAREAAETGYDELADAMPRPIKSQQFQHSHFPSDRCKLVGTR